MKWQDRKKYSRATSSDGQIDFYIRTNREDRFYVEGFLGGGAKHNLPFRNFSTIEEAKAFVEETETKRAETNVRLKEKDTAIKF